MNVKILLSDFFRMKHYFIAAAFVFLLGIVLGLSFSDSFQALITAQKQHLENAVKGLMGQQPNQLNLFLVIFKNNVSIAIIMILTGFFFGIIPLYFLITNGIFVGYVASQHTSQGNWLIFLKGILPHGIIEIFAFILASAYGIRFGFLLMKGFISFPSASYRAKVGQELRSFIKLMIPMVLLVSFLLLVAAGIESTVTYWLIAK